MGGGPDSNRICLQGEVVWGVIAELELWKSGLFVWFHCRVLGVVLLCCVVIFGCVVLVDKNVVV